MNTNKIGKQIRAVLNIFWALFYIAAAVFFLWYVDRWFNIDRPIAVIAEYTFFMLAFFKTYKFITEFKKVFKSDNDLDEEEEIHKRKKNLIETVWDYLSDFWEAFVALIFGALLFVIRKFIKKKTGYGEIPGETLTQKTPPTPEIPTQEAPSTIKEIDLEEENYEVIEPEAPSADSQKVSESDDEDDYDD